MHVRQCLSDLINKRFNQFFRNWLVIFFVVFCVEFKQVPFTMLEDQKELIFLLVHLFQFNDGGMLQFSQRIDFSEFHTLFPIGVFFLYFFYRHDFSCIFISCFQDEAEGSFINFAKNFKGFIFHYFSSFNLIEIIYLNLLGIN